MTDAAHRRHQRPHFAAGPARRQQGGRPQRLRRGAGAQLVAAAAASTSSAASSSRASPEITEIEPGLRAIHLPAGPARYLSPESIYRHLDAFTDAVIDFAAREAPPTTSSTATTGSPASSARAEGRLGRAARDHVPHAGRDQEPRQRLRARDEPAHRVRGGRSSPASTALSAPPRQSARSSSSSTAPTPTRSASFPSASTSTASSRRTRTLPAPRSASRTSASSSSSAASSR